MYSFVYEEEEQIMGVKKEITQTFFQKKRFSNDIKERNIKAKKEAVVEEAPKSLDVEQGIFRKELGVFQ